MEPILVLTTYTMSQQYAQVKINFPYHVRDMLAAKASRFGFSVPMYIKTLVFNDVKSDEPVHYASNRVLKAEKEAIEDMKAGRYTTITTDRELDEHLNMLDAENDED